MYSDFGNHTSKVKLVVNRDVNPRKLPWQQVECNNCIVTF